MQFSFTFDTKFLSIFIIVIWLLLIWFSSFQGLFSRFEIIFNERAFLFKIEVISSRFF